jgi:hypothetical protein
MIKKFSGIEFLSRKELKKSFIKNLLLKKKVYFVNADLLQKITGINKRDFTKETHNKINNYKLSFKFLSESAEYEYNFHLFKIIQSNKLSKSGTHRKSFWNLGWKENLLRMRKNNIVSLYPKYFRNRNYFYRFNGNIIFSKNKYFEARFAELIHLIVVKKYLKGLKNIYEFGAGSGKVISTLIENIDKPINYFASDWANSSIKILRNIIIKSKSIKTFKFNFFAPNNQKINNKSMVITNGALEQTGKNFKKFVQYLINQKTQIIVNFEPLREVYTNNSFNDFVLKFYLHKRNYLDGYIEYLKSLEKKKLLKIISIKRTFGGPNVEGNAFVVWKPI